MTVGELRKALEGVPDDIPVVMAYDGGHQATGDVSDCVVLKDASFEDSPVFWIPDKF